jgi:hypothetical protein
MSFTEDELEAFTTILEQRFTVHRQEMEQVLDRRFQAFQQDIEQRLSLLGQERAEPVQEYASEEVRKQEEALVARLDRYREQLERVVREETEQQKQHIETTVDQMLAAQMLGLEHLFHQQQPSASQDAETLAQLIRPQLEGIEIQTELPWEELAQAIGQMIDSRFTSLHTTFQRSLDGLEQYLAVYLHSLRDELVQSQSRGQLYEEPLSGFASMQEVLEGIAHLERIIESMQIAMTNNHALLSNRLYHHQQLPLERAHPLGFAQTPSVGENGSSLLSQARKRLTSVSESPEAESDEASDETLDEAGGQ